MSTYSAHNSSLAKNNTGTGGLNLNLSFKDQRETKLGRFHQLVQPSDPILAGLLNKTIHNIFKATTRNVISVPKATLQKHYESCNLILAI